MTAVMTVAMNRCIVWHWPISVKLLPSHSCRDANESNVQRSLSRDPSRHCHVTRKQSRKHKHVDRLLRSNEDDISRSAFAVSGIIVGRHRTVYTATAGRYCLLSRR